MANWSINHVTFYGKTESLQKELQSLIAKQSPNEGQLPKGFEDKHDYESSDYIFDLEMTVEENQEELFIHYTTKWGVGKNTLSFLANKHNLEFKGTFLEEQNLPDTCGFIVGVREPCGNVKVVSKVLAEIGVEFEVDYDELLLDGDKMCYVSDFIDDAVETMAQSTFSLLREINSLMKGE